MTEQQFEMAEALDARNRADAIEHASAMVAREGQAECEDCGHLIPPERRLAAPFAIRCIGCQHAQELAQHQFFNRFF